MSDDLAAGRAVVSNIEDIGIECRHRLIQRKSWPDCIRGANAVVKNLALKGWVFHPCWKRGKRASNPLN